MQHPVLIDPERLEPGTYKFQVRRALRFYGVDFDPGATLKVNSEKEPDKLRKCLVMSNLAVGSLRFHGILPASKATASASKKGRRPGRPKGSRSQPKAKAQPQSQSQETPAEAIPQDV